MSVIDFSAAKADKSIRLAGQPHNPTSSAKGLFRFVLTCPALFVFMRVLCRGTLGLYVSDFHMRSATL